MATKGELMDGINLTIPIAGCFYSGPLGKWREYCHDLTAGRVGSYRQSPTYGNQSLKNFFELFRSTWKKPTPTPQPEKYGLVALQPEHLTQSQLIDELLRA
jgi:hypothetical protein